MTSVRGLRKPKEVWVSLYSSWQEYGGPEEGGWYYTRRELVETHPRRAKRAEAERRRLYGKTAKSRYSEELVIIESFPGQHDNSDAPRPYYE